LEQHLQKVEFASLEELAKSVGTSVSTVRRDLTLLESRGSVRRTHGGARILNPKSDEFAFSSRDMHQLGEKETIARACADLIQPRQTVIIDAGTTCYHVAKRLEGLTLQIVTNSLPVANLFASSPKTEVVLSGGVIYPRLGVLVGPLAVEAFRKIHADVAIMSAGGITLDGVTNSHALLIDIQRAMMAGASKVIFCLDHTKFGRQSVAHLCDVSDIDVVVTDEAAPEEIVQALREKKIEVLVAKSAGEVGPQAASATSAEPTPSATGEPAVAEGRAASAAPEALAPEGSQAERESPAIDIGWD
jgi:DeoR/GlpR family transcriptional regulator of sugar metabolism